MVWYHRWSKPSMVFKLVHCTSSKTIDDFSRSRFCRGRDYLTFYQPNKGNAGHWPSFMIIPHRWCDTIDGQNHRWCFNWYIVQVPKPSTTFYWSTKKIFCNDWASIFLSLFIGWSHYLVYIKAYDSSLFHWQKPSSILWSTCRSIVSPPKLVLCLTFARLES